MLNLFIKIVFDPFVDIALTFFYSSFNFFLFDVPSFSLLSKSVFLTKLATSLLLTKFACFILEAKCSVINLLKSGVLIYLSGL